MSAIHTLIAITIQITFWFSIFPRTLQSPHCYVSKVQKSANLTVCQKDYFIFPNIWEESNSIKEGVVKDEVEEQVDVTLCCPVDQKTRSK